MIWRTTCWSWRYSRASREVPPICKPSCGMLGLMESIRCTEMLSSTRPRKVRDHVSSGPRECCAALASCGGRGLLTASNEQASSLRPQFKSVHSPSRSWSTRAAATPGSPVRDTSVSRPSPATTYRNLSADSVPSTLLPIHSNRSRTKTSTSITMTAKP